MCSLQHKYTLVYTTTQQMLHGGSGVTITKLVHWTYCLSGLTTPLISVCQVTKHEIILLTWLLGRVINLSKGSPLARRKGGLVGLKEYQFRHVTSSLYHPRSNGEGEWGVKTVKGLLKKGDEPYLAFLVYRSTSLYNGFSPAEILMNRKLRTNVPSSRFSGFIIKCVYGKYTGYISQHCTAISIQ